MKMKVVLPIFLLLAISCNKAPFSANRTNVILISLDTVRRDCWGQLVGSKHLDMPNIIAIYKRFKGIIFTNAFSVSHYSTPSHMSVFTGLSPVVHSILEIKKGSLPPTIKTLAEILQQKGYTTLAFNSNPVLAQEVGFHRGFEVFINVRRKLAPAEHLIKEAVKYLKIARQKRSPFFAFFNFMDAHADRSDIGQNFLPYYSPPKYRRNVKVSKQEFCIDQKCAIQWLKEINNRRISVPQETVDKVENLYRAGVKYLDHQLVGLFSFFDKEGISKDSLIIIFSDHGEEFREHGFFDHVQPFVETIAIPLMVMIPKQEKPKIVKAPVSITDIFATVLEYLDIPPPNYKLDSVSLLQSDLRSKRLILGVSHPASEFTFFTVDFPLSLKISPHKNKTKLFHLIQDPFEQNDLASISRNRVADTKSRFHKKLEYLIKKRDKIYEDWPREQPYSFSPELEKTLQALGYL